MPPIATQMPVKNPDSSPITAKAPISPRSSITKNNSTKGAETVISKSKSSLTPIVGPAPISKPQASTLESWAQAYDSKKASKNKRPLNLTSAFKRPTYTAAPLKRTTSFISQNAASPPRTPVLEKGNTSTLKPIEPLLTRKSDIMSEIEALIAECRKPPMGKATPSTQNSSSLPIDQNWTATSTFTIPQLNHCLHRLCSELNWDWYGTKYHTLNPNSTPALSKIWGTMVSSMYERYCVERVTPEKSAWKMLVHVEGSDEEALKYFRTHVHNIMMFWVGVEGRGSEEGAIEVLTREKRERLVEFGEALLSGGDILKFVVKKARSVGLVYPGGTGRFEERIRIMTLAKEKTECE